MDIEKIKEIVKKEFNIDVLEVVQAIDKVYIRLPDDLTRGEVEAIVATVSREVPCKPFGTPWRRGFNIKRIYLT
ncbi:hypothetical protein [Candidatus Culexarchaeum yellowstonense]|jgi:hypothetical protein|uniref:hypothetical protein n=1 Tax=Candidatus Culexarchaeum yellowstonense TaxID=2928963 RepID=UPI0026E944AD|nr:hypothetical protein [Candidatus Culexarchaeum yellowstonense]